MRDAIVHSSSEKEILVLADLLARRLGLRRRPLPAGARYDAALAVARPHEELHEQPPVPVVVLPRHATAPVLGGRTVTCGLQDDADAPAVAVAAALAEALRLRLLLVHVVAPGGVASPVPMAPRAGRGCTVEDRARAREIVRAASPAPPAFLRSARPPAASSGALLDRRSPPWLEPDGQRSSW